MFNTPFDVAVGIDGNIVIADTGNYRVRSLNTLTKEVTTLVGTGSSGLKDGPKETATLSGPVGVALDVDGNVFITERNGHCIRRFDPTSGEVVTIAGS